MADDGPSLAEAANAEPRAASIVDATPILTKERRDMFDFIIRYIGPYDAKPNFIGFLPLHFSVCLMLGL